MANLIQEVWIKDIQETLFKGNEFVNRSVNHSGYITGNGVVHIANAGASAGVQKNRATFPGTILQRTDNDITYVLSQYTTDPTIVTALDEVQIAYDKRMSVMGQNYALLGEVIGNQTAYAWAANIDSTRILRTTGSASTLSLSAGATGSRKQMIIADIRALKAKMDIEKVPTQGRVLLIPSDIYNNDLLSIPEVTNALAFGASQAALPEGIVQRLLGFDIMVRPTVLQYSGGTGATQTLYAVDGSGNPTSSAATDNYGALAFSEMMVATAKGDISVAYRDKAENPEYYGSIMSALVMHGARALRSDKVGVYALVQG